MASVKTKRRSAAGNGTSGSVGVAKFLNVGDKDRPEYLNMAHVREVQVEVDKDGECLRVNLIRGTHVIRDRAADYLLAKVDNNRDFFKRAEGRYINLGLVETIIPTKDDTAKFYWAGSHNDDEVVRLEPEETEALRKHLGKYVKQMPASRSRKKSEPADAA